MRVKQLFGRLGIASVILALMLPAAVQAKGSMADESIYDLLVDRYNDASQQNDEGVNPLDPYAFNGGDFHGVASRLQHILDMGFTIVSIGPVFSMETYDGSRVLDYGKTEPHFGTEEELQALVDEIHDKKMKVIADFPLGVVSENHVWVKEGKLKFTPAGDGVVRWDAQDPAVQKELKQAVVDFVSTYGLDGIRLTNLNGFGTDYLNDLIQSVKEKNPGAYVISHEVSDAAFDLQPNPDRTEALRQSFIEVNPDSSVLSRFLDNPDNEPVQFDDLIGSRFTYDIVEKRMFPPTRWKLAATALFTMPGTPIMPYGTEIAVNGKEAPESHPLMNFKTDMELKDRIADLNSLRNQSETLRTGDFNILHNENGFLVYTRSSEDETWLIAINNTDKTASVAIPAETIGQNKKLRGLLDSDLIRESDDGVFRVVMDRETEEIYIADEDKGFNTPYLVATILVCVLFLIFLILVMKRGKNREAQNSVTK
ncbi:alpha-amylase family glycosyl hydrolase [Sporosarcina sp. Te-1]|uniref:alpha-amylase family glycosyl hydrolase n=1 Tax=Sporosarcina sp. Te-1 TaxID=2818390 RepID=UPI001A9EDAF7|nr:alpha-amylase family glycosyl hydrolase [Sporosarcina sp. Te-1]QTD41212.1 alpha-glucosidase C-terminal domain-containing protein [Sporosarcina sp. Te-1]